MIFICAKRSQIDGSLIWVKQFAGIDNPASGRIVAIASKASSYAFVGIYIDSISIDNDTLVSLNNSIDVFALNTDLDGNVNWIREISGTGIEYSYSINAFKSGGFFIRRIFSSTSLLIDSTAVDQIVI